MKNKLIILFFLFIPSVYGQESGNSKFVLYSGDDRVFTSHDMMNFVVICFYETDDTKDDNMELKAELESFREALTGDEESRLIVLAVADCSEAKRPFLNFWKEALIEQSEKIGYILYGDWTGEMREYCGFRKETSNFAIFDKNGNIQYQCNSVVDKNEFNDIKVLLFKLIKE